MNIRKSMIGWAMLLLLFAGPAFAHVDGYPSIHDVIADIKERMVAELDKEQLPDVDPETILSLVTDEEREALSEAFIRFTVNTDVVVYVMKRAYLTSQPFWIEEQGFTDTQLDVIVDDDTFDVWSKTFPAGRIGLGIPSFIGADPYLVALEPVADDVALEVTELYPGQMRVSELTQRARPWADDNDPLTYVPEDLEGITMIRTLEERDDETRLVGIFSTTRFPATAEPDQIVLTWSDDPATTQTVQWRTSTDVDEGYVQYIKKSDYQNFTPGEPKQIKATTQVLETPNIVNDPVNHRHYATMTGLEPHTTYLYAVGDGSEDGWTQMYEFTTAPDRVVPFSFIYLGDAQNGLDRWGSLAKQAFRHRPDAAFWIMAGDLVNRGNERWDWDDFFYNAQGIYEKRQLVPAIGNHENQGGSPWMYLEMFDLPDNGPETVENERAYAMQYSNALIVVLDSNLPAAEQTEWLEEQLANSDAMWKFVVHHHPAYSSAPGRNNQSIRDHWVPIYDEYEVDLVLQGHDHAYLRTYPMKDNQPVDSPDEGTIYVVSVSGVKMYDQGDFDYKEFGMTNVSTYQVLDIRIVGDRLLYRAYDEDGDLRDEFEIVKSTW